MKIKLNDGQSALDADIEHLEHEIGSSLPKSYVEFIRQYDGAKPDKNFFNVEGITKSRVARFIPVREILTQRVNFHDISKSSFPVAWDDCGNFVILDAKTEAVYFWDHELLTPPHKLAADFAFFLEMLEPAIPVKLKPGQVKNVWIKPGFLQSLKDKGDPSVS